MTTEDINYKDNKKILDATGVRKALECWAISKDFNPSQCIGCAFETKDLCSENCSEDLAKASLALINYYETELDKLRKHLGHMGQHALILTEVARTEAIKEFENTLIKELGEHQHNYAHINDINRAIKIFTAKYLKEMEHDKK